VSRIDNIFSPKKLRKRWKPDSSTAEKKSDTATPPSTQSEKVHREFKRLQELAHQRFHGEKREALNIMMSELNELLIMRFPEPGSGNALSGVSKQDDDALNPAIEELLDQIEEVIDALGLGGNE
jgi:hypothetical protein